MLGKLFIHFHPPNAEQLPNKLPDFNYQLGWRVIHFSLT